MKSVLISIRPMWCELIASGKKTIEVRKTRPKIETPFKCYIYCTKPKMITKYVFKPEDYPEYMYDSEDKLHCQRILKLSILYKSDGTQEALAECLDCNQNAVYMANVSQLVVEGEKND